ncbi:MAG TPA: carboxypeptidase-like regulatory domain-containing protein [Bryobacteraceae bacterium]|jgi:hypothetical protein|nr:carboxypeptidase-like regulatory domain-containing protein [Bryobacteraceae bacterium]
MKNLRAAKWASFGFAAALLLTPSALPQTAGTGALTVTATDPGGGVIPGASVTLTNPATGQTRSETTSTNGSYTFTLLPPGNYNVKITAKGFNTVDVPAVAVNVTETHVLNQTLAVGSQEQQVTIEAAAQAIQTETSALGGVVDSQAITAIPLATRNYQQILSLSPGVTSAVTDATAVGRSSPFVFVNGLSNVSNDYQTDGVTVTNYPNGVADESSGFYGSMAVPNPDALQEFKVQTSLFDAGYGRNAGANVNVVTKSGTNDIHGTLFEFFRNTDLDANNFFANRAGTPRGVLNQNQFGGTIGGPIKKDKLFLFLSYQGTRQINGVTALGFSVVPLPEQLTQIDANARSNAATLRSAVGSAFCPQNNIVNGAPGPGYIFANTLNSGATAANPLGTISRDQVACDGSNINPVVISLLQAKNPDGTYIIPTLLPSQLVATKQSVLGIPNTTVLTGQLPISIPARFKEDQALGSLDYIVSSKNTLSAKYYYSYSPLNSAFPAANQPEGGGQLVLGGNQLALLRLTSILTNNLVNEARVSYYYVRAGSFATDPLTPSQVGINLSPSWLNVMPVINTGVFSFGGSGVSGSLEPQNYYEYSDQLSWTHGKHTIRTGYDQQRISMLNRVTFPDRGSIAAPTWADFLLGTSAANNGTAQSNLSSASITETTVGGATNYLRNNILAAFVQDDVKVSKKLTLNLGLRWEYDGLEYDALGNAFEPWAGLMATVPVPPATGTYAGYTVASNYASNPSNPPLPAGIFTRPVKTLSENNAPLNNFGPRIGFAWQPFGSSGRFVVRGGGGKFYNLIHGNVFQIITNSGPPIATAASYSGAAEVNGTLQNPVSPLPSLGFAGAERFPSVAAALAAGAQANQAALSYGEVDQHVQTPDIYTWNLDTQYEVRPSLIVDVGFVANRAEHLYTGTEYNIPVLALPGVAGINNVSPAQPGVNCANTVANLGPGCITTNTFANANSRVPILGFRAGGLTTGGNVGDSEYESLQAQVRKTFSHGLQFQAAYTYARNLTDIAGAAFSGGSGGSTLSNDPSNRQQQHGNSDYIRPHRLIVNFSYTVPNFLRASGLAEKLVTGWGVSGVATFQSGTYMTFTDSNGGGAYGITTSRAQLCPGMTYGSIFTSGSIESRLNGYFNSSAFANASAATSMNPACPFPLAPNNAGDPKATLFGNTGRAILLGPGQNNWDLSLTKRTVVGGLRESASIEFRAEAFNIFNHAQFNNPGTAVSSPTTFGIITSTSVGPRVMQLALKYIF